VEAHFWTEIREGVVIVVVVVDGVVKVEGAGCGVVKETGAGVVGR